MNKLKKVYLYYFSLLEKAINSNLPSEWAYNIIENKFGSDLAKKVRSRYIKFLNENNHEERKKLIKRLDQIKRAKETQSVTNKTSANNLNSRKSSKPTQQEIDYKILQNQRSGKRESDPRYFKGASRSM